MLNVNNLPEEILIEIFQYQDYWHLKHRVAAVTRNFRRIVREGHLGRELFRDTPVSYSPSAMEMIEFTLHPVIRLLKYTPSNGELGGEAFLPCNPAILQPCKRPLLRDITMANENAVSPAVERLTLMSKPLLYNYCKEVGYTMTQVIGGPDGQKAVSVRDIVNAMAILLNGYSKRSSQEGYRIWASELKVKEGQLYFYIRPG